MRWMTTYGQTEPKFVRATTWHGRRTLWAVSWEFGVKTLGSFAQRDGWPRQVTSSACLKDSGQLSTAAHVYAWVKTWLPLKGFSLSRCSLSATNSLYCLGKMLLTRCHWRCQWEPAWRYMWKSARPNGLLRRWSAKFVFVDVKDYK